MKKEVTLGQMLAIGLSVLLTVSAWAMTMSKQVSAQAERIKALEDNQLKWDHVVERIEAKIDRNNETTTQVLIELNNKKNRPQ